MKDMSPKILIIGIDGATFTLIKPWVNEGKLPAFKSLMNDGAFGNLKSTIPPLTPPAWTSFMTGKNPGKHGLYNFIEHQPNTYDIRYSNAKTRRSRSIWSIINSAQYRVGVINVPMTYPPEEVDGYMISGMDTPDEGCNFIYPPELAKELKKTIGHIQLDLKGVESMASTNKHASMLESMKVIEEKRIRTTLYLMENHPVDVMMVVFRATDHAQHFFWHYMDPTHYQYNNKEAEKYKDSIFQMYNVIDNGISELLRNVSDETVIVLMSDHGAGPTAPNILFLDQFLLELDLLTYKDSGNGLGGSKVLWYNSVKRVGEVVNKTIPTSYKQKIGRIFPSTKKAWGRYTTLFEAIDWSKTKAYTMGGLLTFPQGIWINETGKRPNGIVNPGTEYEELVSYITGKLYELKDPTSGQQLIRKIYKKEDIYNGPYVEWAPDITLEWWTDNAFISKPGLFKDSNKIVSHVDEYKEKNISNLKCRSGEHRLDGIMLLKGNPFKPGEISTEPAIIDLAPTLLYLLGIPIPSDMDGRVIRSAFTKEYLDSNPILFQKGEEPVNIEASAKTYSDEEAKAIEDKLRGLGYID